MTILSPLTWQQLRELKPHELDTAAEGWETVSRFADATGELVGDGMTRVLAKTQESESAKAAVTRLRRLSDNYGYIKTECGMIRTLLSGLADELRSAQRRLDEALSDADSLSYTVGVDGSVNYPAYEGDLPGAELPGGTAVGDNGLLSESNRGLYPPGEHGYYVPGTGPEGFTPATSANPHRAKAQDIADRIAVAVREAQEADEHYGTVLRRLRAPEGLEVDNRTWADAGADLGAVRETSGACLAGEIPLDKSPAVRKKWWDSLDEDQRTAYLASYPDVLGNLDGIPATVRDDANRRMLPILIAEYEEQPGERAEARLGGLRGIAAQLERNAATRLVDPTEPPAYLIGLSDEGTGRAIVAYGNPDASRNVAAYVPGLRTSVDAEFARDDLQRARDTAYSARQIDPSSATLVWLGYDAPQLLGPDSSSLLSNADVMSAERAEKGAQAYNAFMDGLTVTNEHQDPHMTTIGHSYGSRLVGAATQSGTGIPGADDIVLVGSPGTGVDSAEDLGVGKNHVFVGSAGNDPVTHLPSKQQMAAAAPLGGNFVLSYLAGDVADQGDDDLWFGKDPASRGFGARRFKVDDGPLPLISGQEMVPAHSNYFSPQQDPESAANLAAVVAGRADLVDTESYR